MAEKKISREELLKAERDRIVDSICNDKELLGKVYEIMFRLCVSADKKILFNAKRGKTDFMGVYIPAKCCAELVEDLKKRYLTPSDLHCFCNSRIPPLYFHDVMFYTILRDIFYLILFIRLRDFLKQRGWVRYQKYNNLGKLILTRLIYTMANKFTETYPCAEFFNDWENKSARYVLSGKHRKEINLSEYQRKA
ncbi:MAG: hypothetical protein LBM93_07945 [Oscillospiraceae bacterium]|jgi:hypothetical protein|nr:hypothetical protein [Oscillospiraceae bacterium]